VIEAPERSRDQTRARYPDEEGYVERDGVRVFYEVYGEGEPAMLLFPPWSIVHSRVWKAQIPWFARRHRVITFDGRGNGRSDRPAGRAYRDPEFVADAVAILDEVEVERAVVCGASRAGRWALRLGAEHPDRAAALVIESPGIAMTPGLGAKSVASTFDVRGSGRLALKAGAETLRLAVTHPSELVSHTARVARRHTSPFESARMFNRHRWRDDYRGFLEWFFGLVFLEPHSTKQIEDSVSWGLETTPETLIDTIAGDFFMDRATAIDLCARVRCPALVLSGGDDIITPPAWAAALAETLGARHLSFPGYGHTVAVRHPVAYNLAVRDFLAEALA
jgi:pimeloyl-ACP methyl ester carboxylesterase